MNLTEIIILAVCGIISILYAVISLSFAIGWRLLKKKSGDAQLPETSVSIIIPARDEVSNISFCIDCIAAQDYPFALIEVLIADDHSTDRTIEVAREAGNKHTGLNLRVLPAKNDEASANKKTVLAAAIKETTGTLILTSDADCRMGPQWLSSIVEAFQKTGAGMIVGPLVFQNEKGIFQMMQSLEFSSLVASGAGAIGIANPIMCNGANLAFSRQVYEQVVDQIPGRNFASGDDVFLLHIIKKQFGSKAITFIRDRRAVVSTFPAQSIHDFFSQRVRWASKSKGYKDSFTMFIALVVFIDSISIILLPALALIYHRLLVFATVPLLLKMILDLPLLTSFLRFTAKRNLLWLYLPVQIIYPFYIVISGSLGLIGKYSWKGRSQN